MDTRRFCPSLLWPACCRDPDDNWVITFLKINSICSQFSSSLIIVGAKLWTRTINKFPQVPRMNLGETPVRTKLSSRSSKTQKSSDSLHFFLYCFTLCHDWSGTFCCFFPVAGSPLRMLASMASMSFTTKQNNLSQKLNTSWKKTRETKKVVVKIEEKAAAEALRVRGRGNSEPAGWRRRPGCWTAGWTRRPSCPSRRERSRCSSFAGSRSRLSWRQCTAWTCRSCSWPLWGRDGIRFVFTQQALKYTYTRIKH